MRFSPAREAFTDCLERLPSALAESGIPYAGFSAGAALAARHAVVGGRLDGGVPVCHEDTAEDLEEIAVRDGLGLVPFSVDVHAAQWGTLPRLMAAVAGRGLRHGVAVDENTVVEVAADGRALVSGLGRAHSVRPSGEGGVLVRSYGAGEYVPVGRGARAEAPCPARALTVVSRPERQIVAVSITKR